MLIMFPIIEKLGGWEKIEPLLARQDLLPGDEGIKKWRARGISAKASLFLSLLASERGVAVTQEDFVFQRPIAAE